MTERLVRDEKPAEFFKEQLEKAMQHQKVSTTAFTEYYLVNLLADCVQTEPLLSEPGYEQTPLALLYVRALAAPGYQRARLLRALGDTALGPECADLHLSHIVAHRDPVERRTGVGRARADVRRLEGDRCLVHVTPPFPPW